MIPIFDAGGRLVGHVADAKVLRPLPGGSVLRVVDQRDRLIAVFFTGRWCASPSCSCQAFQPHAEVPSSCAQCRHHSEDHAWAASLITSLITPKKI